MKTKFVLALVTVTTVVFLAGCSKKPKEETAMDVDKLLENQAMAPANAAATAQMAQTTGVPGQVVTPMDQVGNQTMDTASDAMQAVSSSTSPSAKDIQQALKNAGFYHGKVDGDVGPRTKKAIRDFQTQSNLRADGKVGHKTWAKLSPYLNQAAQEPAAAAPTEISN